MSSTTWKPTDDRMNYMVYPAWDEIRGTCDDLLESLECPPSFVGEMLVVMASEYSEERN